MLDIGAQDGDAAVLVPGLGFQRGVLAAHLFLLDIVVLHLTGDALIGLIQFVQPGLGRLLPGLGRGEIRLELEGPGLDLIQFFQPHGDFQHAQLVPQDQVPLRLLRLIPQRFYLQLQLRDLVVDAHQVLLCALHFPLGLLLAVAVLGNTCRLLKDLPAVGAPDGQDLVDPALADDGVPLPAQARVHEQLVDILQPHGLLVDVVFTLPAAVVAARHHDLAAVDAGEDVLAVVQHQRHLGKPHRAALLRTAEDHVLHLAPPQAPGGLLPHDPADGV